MISFKNALTAGCVATVVVGSALVMKNAMKLLPDVHLAQTLSSVFDGSLVAGGVAFFVIWAVIFGLAYAWLAPLIPVRSNQMKGIVFGFGVWLVMMLVLMPAAGAGVFALHRSATVAAFHLVLMLVYGSVLAALYSPDTDASQNARATPGAT